MSKLWKETTEGKNFAGMSSMSEIDILYSTLAPHYNSLENKMTEAQNVLMVMKDVDVRLSFHQMDNFFRLGCVKSDILGEQKMLYTYQDHSAILLERNRAEFVEEETVFAPCWTVYDSTHN